MEVTKYITISRPVNVVFDYLAQPESAMEWQGSVIESTNLSEGPPSMNTKTKVVQTLIGHEVTFVFRTTAYEPNSTLAFTTESGPADITGKVECKQLENSTHVTFTLSTQLSGFFKFIDPQLQELVQNEMQKDVERLKTILESP